MIRKEATYVKMLYSNDKRQYVAWYKGEKTLAISSTFGNTVVLSPIDVQNVRDAINIFLKEECQ